MRSSTIKNNFTSGELTPLMYGRTELEPYQKGLAECKNMRVLRHGGVTRREGTHYVGEVKDSSKTVRLLPFVFSESDAVILELGDGYMRFWDKTGPVLGSAEEVTNGIFNSDITTGWTTVIAGTATATWDAATASLWLRAFVIGDSVQHRQTISGLTVGGTYNISWENKISSSGACKLAVGTTLGASDLVNGSSVVGIHSTTFVAPAGGTIYLQAQAINITGLGTFAYFDNISIKEVAGSILDVVTPYTEAELFEVMYAQSNDFMWFAHKNHPPQTLIRISATSYTFAEAVITRGPYYSLNAIASIKMAIINGTTWVAGDTGDISATVGPFSSTDVGLHVIVYDDADVTQFGEVKITSYSSATSVGVTFVTDIPAGARTFSVSWAFQAIGTKYGYPAAVTFHDQRLIYAGIGSSELTQNVYGSTVGDFQLFSVGADDDDYYDYRLASTKQNAIFWLAVKHDLIIGTVSNEWAMRGGGLENPITPSNVVTRPYRSEGSIRVQPDEVNDLIVFVQRAGHKIIGLSYSEDTRSLNTTDLMLLSEHLTTSSIVKQLSYQSERESVLWCVTSTGQLLGMTYDASQAILAWHQHTTGASGEFESVATIPVTIADQTWVVVKRTIDGSTVRLIEYLDDKDWRVDDDPYYVDSGISYNGASATVITGLDHLEGEDVVVYAGGEFVGEFTVASGQITLDNAVTQAHIGLNYVSTFTELPEGSNSEDGSAHTRQKRKAKVDLRLYKTQGIIVNGDVRDLPRDASTSKPELFSGIIDSTNLGWDKDAANTVTSIGPNPLTVLAIRSTLLTGQE